MLGEPNLYLLALLRDFAEEGLIDPYAFRIVNTFDGLGIMDVPDDRAALLKMEDFRSLVAHGHVTLDDRGKGEYEGALTRKGVETAAGLDRVFDSVAHSLQSALYEAAGGEPSRTVAYSRLSERLDRYDAKEVARAVSRLEARELVSALRNEQGEVITIAWTPQGYEQYSQLRAESERGDEGNDNAGDPHDAYVAPRRIEELRAVPQGDFDTRRLVQLCEELNAAYASRMYVAMGALQRAIVDHVPKALGQKNFDNVAAQVGGSSFKRQMKHLNEQMKRVADGVLHRSIGRKSPPVEFQEVDFKAGINTLLDQVIESLE